MSLGGPPDDATDAAVRNSIADGVTIVQLFCDSAASRVSCSVTFGGGVWPFQTRWTFNGFPRAAWDNLFNVNSSCQAGTSVDIGVRLIGANGLEDSRATRVACRRINP